MAASKEAKSHFTSNRPAQIGATKERVWRIKGVWADPETRVQKRLPVSLAATLRERARWFEAPNLLESEYGVGSFGMGASMELRRTEDA
jgi:hypothetical protein